MHIGDILDLIGKTFNLPDFKDQLDKAVEIYGLTQNFSPSAQQQTVNIIKNIGISQHSADMSDYFAKCHAALKDTSYFTGRGSSQELLDRFNIGYDASFTDNGKLKKPMQAVIFPTSTQTFEARNMPSFRAEQVSAITNTALLSNRKKKNPFLSWRALSTPSSSWRLVDRR